MLIGSLKLAEEIKIHKASLYGHAVTALFELIMLGYRDVIECMRLGKTSQSSIVTLKVYLNQ